MLTSLYWYWCLTRLYYTEIKFFAKSKSILVVDTQNLKIAWYREFHTRKSSRAKTTEDLIRQLLASSDPVISSLRTNTVSHGTSLTSDAMNLFINEIEEGEKENREDEMSNTDACNSTEGDDSA